MLLTWQWGGTEEGRSTCAGGLKLSKTENQTTMEMYMSAPVN